MGLCFQTKQQIVYELLLVIINKFYIIFLLINSVTWLLRNFWIELIDKVSILMVQNVLYLLFGKLCIGLK